MKVTGTVTIQGANLNLSTGSTSYADYYGIPFTIIDNEGSSAVSGTLFNGLAEGKWDVLNSEGYQISYAGGGSNSVTLTQGPLWQGATSGAENNQLHEYDYAGNWVNDVVDDSFDDVTLAGDTTLYLGTLGSSHSTGTSGLAFNYFGNHLLTIESSTSSPVSLVLAGNLSGGYGSAPGTQSVTFGNADAPLNLALGGSAVSFNIASGDSLLAQNEISGGTLSVYGGGTLGVEDACTLTLSVLNVNGGAMSLDSTGAVSITTANVDGGTLSVGEAGDLYGTTLTTNAGTLSMGVNNALSGTALNIDGGIFDLNGTDQTVTGLNGTGGMIVNDDSGTTATLTDSESYPAYTEYSGAIADSSTASGGILALALTGSALLTLDGNNSYSGGTTVASGTVLNTDGISTDSLGTGGIVNDGELYLTLLTPGVIFTVTNDISGSGVFYKDGNGTLIYTGVNSDSGGVAFYGGQILIDGSFDSDVPTFNVNDGTVLGGTGSISGSTTVEDGGTLEPAGSGDGLKISGTVTVDDGGTLGPSLGGDNTGVLSIADLIMDSGSYLNVQIDGVSAGSSYDQVDVTGTVSISGANTRLFGSLTGFQDEVLTAIDDDDAASASISFAQPSAQLNGIWYSINSTAGTGGNDVALSASHIVTIYGELIVTASGTDDSVSVSENEGDSALAITYDGESTTYPLPSAGLFIYTRGGADSVDIDSTVHCPTTVETISDTGSVAITSAGSDVEVWDDSRDSFSGSGALHTITSVNLLGGATLATGNSLPDPTDIDNFIQPVLPLWGTGPVIGDVNQGDIGDCYFMASLAAFANGNPSMLEQSAVDMGDGTYVVQFWYEGNPVYVRVNDDLNFAQAYIGTNMTIWALIMEKAFVYFHTYDGYGTGYTYESINGGNPDEVYIAMGSGHSDLYLPSFSSDPSTEAADATAFYDFASAALSANQAVTLGTPSSDNGSDMLVGGHVYTLISITMVAGIPYYTLRNPWGHPPSGSELEDGAGVTYPPLTYLQIQENCVEVLASVG